MRGIEPLQHFRFVMRNVDTGSSSRESVTTDSNRAQRGKLLKGQIHHLSSKTQPPEKLQHSVVILSEAKDLCCFSLLPKALIRDVSLRST
jgi:hypothetical protein